MRCERRREQTSSYQWGKNGGGAYRGRGGKSGILWDYMKSYLWNFWKL